MTEELLIEKLLKYNWDTTNIKLALRAKFKCEYCDKNMFESIDNYKLWQVDHIIPKCSGYLDCEDFDNKALSCTQCNKDFKGKWKPNSQSIDKIERTKYILEIRKFIEDKRAIKEKELDEIKKIFEAYFISNKITYSTKTKFNK